MQGSKEKTLSREARKNQHFYSFLLHHNKPKPAELRRGQKQKKNHNSIQSAFCPPLTKDVETFFSRQLSPLPVRIYMDFFI